MSNVGLINDETREWIHPLGDIISALIRAGITIQSVREWPTDAYSPTTLSDIDGRAGVPELPGLFSIKGGKPR